MMKTAILTTAAAVTFTAAAALHTPKAHAIEHILDMLEEFDDIAEDYEDCDYEWRRVKVKIWTKHGPRWVWAKRRYRDCD